MFESTRKNMPAQDYVSVVASLFKEKLSLAIGVIVSACAVLTVYLHTGIREMLIFAVLFVLSGIIRQWMISRFEKAQIAEDDIVEAAKWELRATIVTVATALVYGVWSFVSIAFVADPYAQLASSMVSIAVLIGLTSRSFANDRLVTLSSAAIAIPLAAGLFTVGNPYYFTLGILLMPYLFSLRSLAAGTRRILLAAVHGRQDASRFAAELDMALSTMPHGLCMIDKDGKLCVVNEQAQNGFFHYTGRSCTGRKFADIIAEARKTGHLSGATADYLESEVAQGGHSKLVIGMPDGRQCEITINTRLGHTVLMMEDITERVQSAERINYMARYDGLTHLANRSFFSEQVTARLKEEQALDSREAVMMMIVDVDDFKHVNDTYGHPAGDALLVEVSRRLAQVFGSDAMIARFGGDEFAVFRMTGVNQKSARRDADAVLSALREPAWIMNELMQIKASMGIAVSGNADSTLEDLLRRADLALYDAKAKGSCKFSLFHEEMDTEYRMKQRLRADLADALGNGEFYLLFQPIVDIRTGRATGCEALIRWRHPELGMIPPQDFIAIAEEIGAMPDISKWVLAEAAKACAKWPESMSVSVNLSATDFRDGDVEKMVRKALSRSKLAPGRLTVEITETTIIEELDGAIAALTGLRKLGVDVALDDFGTGYSSLSYLQKLPFTKLKIDRSFVIDVTTSSGAQQLLSNIAKLSADLDLSVTVEGVETEEQLAIITATPEIGFAQGYLFGVPLPQKDIQELISRTSGQMVLRSPVKAAAS